MKFRVVEGCVSVDAYQLMYEKKVRIDLKKAAEGISKIGEVLGETRVVLLAKVGCGSGQAAVSVYEDGRVLIKNVSEQEAEEIGQKITDALEKNGAFL